MGGHLVEVDSVQTFQSDKYPTCPAGKVPLSVKDPSAQALLWEYAQRRRAIDAEFADDLETSLLAAGYQPLADAQPVPPDGNGGATCCQRHIACPERAGVTACDRLEDADLGRMLARIKTALATHGEGALRSGSGERVLLALIPEVLALRQEKLSASPRAR